MTKFDDLEFDKWRGLGREFSEHHKDFQDIAHLGNLNAKKRAALEFIFWLKKQKNGVDLEKKLKKIVELLGEAEFLTIMKAWERMTVSLGDTTPKRKWKKSG